LLSAVPGKRRNANDTPVSDFSENNRRLDQMKFRLGLLEKLQQSLDLETLLEIFFKEVQQILPLDGLSFSHEIADIKIDVADSGQHLFQYSLVTSKEMVGELAISRHQPFTSEEINLLRQHLDTLVYPLRNALNYDEAVRASLKDALTGTGNRIALSSALHREIELSKRYSQSMAVLMLDMDNFKNINDMFGHHQGDEVLISVTETIAEDLRGSDSIFRFGGEEFVVLLSNTDLEWAIHIAERLRSKIEKLSIEKDSIRIITTTSIGIAMLDSRDTITKLLDRADQAMYEAKNSGRNQVKVSENPYES
jgi:diguanylate cyclase (GGDEF)-like protein